MSSLFRFRVAGDDGGGPQARPAGAGTTTMASLGRATTGSQVTGGSGGSKPAGTAFRATNNSKPFPPAPFQPASRSDAAAALQGMQNTDEEKEKVTAWQNEMDSLEQTQMQIQADQMNLLHSQIHILTRELGDLQKNFAFLLQKVEDDGAALTSKVEDIQVSTEDAMREAHAALRLELAEHGKNAEEMKSAMEEAHLAMSQAMEDGFGNMSTTHARALEDHAEQLRADIQGMSDEHHEKHAQNADALENGLQNVLESTHSKLQAELGELRSGHVTSAGSIREILADVTQQVDTLTLSLEKEHELRMAVEEKLDKMCEEMRNEVQVAFEESHAALKLELAEHSGKADDIRAAMEEAHMAIKGEWIAHAQANDDKHQNTMDMLQAMNDEHHDKHAVNAQNLEVGLQNVLGETHNKLQEEMRLLKSGGSGSLKDLSKILVDVTQQVDTLDQALQKEHELRVTVETKMDQMFTDQDAAISQLREELSVALHESHAALQLELAEHGGKAEDIKAAMADAHAAMKEELGMHKQSLDEFGDTHHAKMRDLQSQLQGDLQRVQEEHQEKHAVNSQRLEDGLNDMLGGSHAKLQEELRLLKSGGGPRTLQDLSKIVADVTEQVDTLDEALKKEHELRMACETKMDQMFNEQDEVVCQLKQELRVAMEESHAALKLELAEHGGKTEEIQNAMAEAHLALKDELDLHRQNLETHATNHAEMLQNLNAEHHEKHAANDAKMEEGLSNVLENAHAKLQEELQLLKSGGAVDLPSLAKIVADVTQQVDNLEQSLQQEHELRMACETKMDQMFNDQDQVVCQIKEELGVALEESHAALKLELAEHGGKAEEIKAAMAEAQTAMQDELNLHKQTLEEHGNTHGVKMRDLESVLRGDMSKMNDEHHEKHALNAQKMEDSLNNVLGGTHAKLREEMQLLKSGSAGSVQELSKIMADVTQQVDNLDQAVQKEHELRMNVDARLDQMLTSQEATINQLKEEVNVALHESHAALRVELAEHSKNGDELRAAMADAHGALRQEFDMHKSSLGDNFNNHGVNMQKMEAQLRKDMSKINDDHHYKHSMHAQRYEGLESGLHNVLTNTHAKLQQDLKNMTDNHFNLSEMLTDVTKQVDTLTLAVDREHDLRMAVEGKLDQMVEQLRGEHDNAHQALRNEHGAVFGDLSNQLELHGQALHAKHATIQASLDQRVQLLETSNTDKHNAVYKELQGTHGKIQELFDHIVGIKSRNDLVASSLEERIAFMERQVQQDTDNQNTIHNQLRNEALAREKNLTAIETRIAKVETYFTDVTDRHAEALNRFDQSRAASEQHKVITEQRLAALDRAVLESADNQSHALNAVRVEHGQFLQAERAARETQEKTFLDYINDGRAQKEMLENSTNEQFRVERHSREMQLNQLKDAMANSLNQINWQGQGEFTDMVLQERSSREAAERTLERRIEVFERSIQMERNERAVEMQRIWEAFDGHTHEAMSPIVRELPGPVRAQVMPQARALNAASLVSPRSTASVKMLSEVASVSGPITHERPPTETPPFPGKSQSLTAPSSAATTVQPNYHPRTGSALVPPGPGQAVMLG